MKGKIFNAQEVQAIIAGYETQFREVIKPYPILSDEKSYWEFKGVRWAGENSSYAKNTIEGFWGELKRGIKGIYHWASHKHIQKYCVDFLGGLANTKLTYKTLTA